MNSTEAQECKEIIGRVGSKRAGIGLETDKDDTLTSQLLRATERHSVPNTCSCEPTATCPICKDDKLAAGIAPKYDTGKLQFSLVPPVATEALASVLTFGATKYAPNSWQSVQEGERRYTDALYRHLEAYRSGEHLDRDSNLPHLHHAITNIAFLIHFEKERLKDKT